MHAPMAMMSKTHDKNKKQHPRSWNPSNFPYETDYNDHFETPLVAYQDVQPIIDWIAASATASSGKSLDESISTGAKNSLTLYDPYYCNGRTLSLLRDGLGYSQVIHERRDFYRDIRHNQVPRHDLFITNPPYSDQHKIQCLQFCFQQLRTNHIPFLLLMPAYVATKSYYRNCLLQQQQHASSSSSFSDVVYLIPQQSYRYEHPEHTGKDTSPFDSLWFCGIGQHRVEALQNYWLTTTAQHNNKPTLAISLTELEQTHRVISFANRPNPRQRRKKQQQQQQTKQPSSPLSTTTSAATTATKIPKDPQSLRTANPKKQPRKMSKYRDVHGNRKRKRF
jgi:hypothetical protein